MAKPIILNVIEPLLNLLNESGKSEQTLTLYNKVGGIINNRFKTPKELAKFTNVQLALDTLAKLHEMSTMNLNAATLAHYSIISVFLAKSILASDNNTAEKPKSKKQKVEPGQKVIFQSNFRRVICWIKFRPFTSRLMTL